jgi:O-antigen/teichoic acid export membrane protein
MTIERRSFRSDVAHSFGTNIVIALINLATGIMVARLLRPPGRGELAAIFNWPTVFSVLAVLGMSESLVYFCARERDRSGRYLGTSLVIALGASVVFVVLGWVLMPVLLLAQRPETVATARLYLLMVPIGAVLGLLARPLRGIGDIRGWNYLSVTHYVVWLLVLIAAALRGHATARSLAMGFVGARLLLVPFTYLVVRHRMGRRLRVERSLSRPLLRYGFPNVLAVLPNIFNMRLDQLLMAVVLPARDLGLYVVAVSWSQVTSPVLLAFTTVLFPRIAEADDEQRRVLAARGMRIGTLVSVLLMLIALPLTEIVIPLIFGPDYQDAVPAGVILVVAFAASSTNSVQQEALRGLGRPSAVLYSQLAGLVMTVLGLALFLVPLGIEGAALASLMGYSTIVLVLVFVGARATSLPWPDVVLPRRGDIRFLIDQIPDPVRSRLHLR